MIEEFGEKLERLHYQRRRGVYAVIFHHQKDRVMTVRNETGHYFLPGGGMEEGESHLECLERELIEETGYRGVICSYIGNAMCYFHSKKGDPLLNEGTFYLVELKEKVQEPVDHVIECVDRKDVKRLLLHEHHEWAVRKAEKMLKDEMK